MLSVWQFILLKGLVLFQMACCFTRDETIFRNRFKFLFRWILCGLVLRSRIVAAFVLSTSAQKNSVICEEGVVWPSAVLQSVPPTASVSFRSVARNQSPEIRVRTRRNSFSIEVCVSRFVSAGSPSEFGSDTELFGHLDCFAICNSAKLRNGCPNSH